MLFCTCSCAVVRGVLCALSGFAATGGRCCLAPVRVPWSWPAACLSGVPRGPAWCAAPRPVRSLSVLWSAFLTPWCLPPSRGPAPLALLGGCAGHAEAGREPGSWCLPLVPAEAGTPSSLRVVPVRKDPSGLSLTGPSSVGFGLRALRCLACVDPVTYASGFPYRPSFDRGLGRCTGAVSCGRRHLPLRVGGRHARVPCVCACARPSWPGRAGRPLGRVLVRLTFSFRRFVFLLCLAPSGLGSPLSWSFACPLPPPITFFLCFLPLLFFRAPPLVSCFLWFRAPVVLGFRAVCCVCCWPRPSGLSAGSRLFCFGRLATGCSLVPPPPFGVSRFLLLPLGALWLFSPSFLRPRCLWLSLVSGPGCPGPWRCALRFFPPVSWLSSPVLCLLLGCWLLPGGCCPTPPYPFVSRGFRRCRSVLFFFPLPVCASFVFGFLWFPAPAFESRGFRRCRSVLRFFSFFLRCAPPLSLAFSGFRPQVPWASPLCVVCFVGLPLVGSPCALASFVLPADIFATTTQ